jgi:hypothetical protein
MCAPRSQKPDFKLCDDGGRVGVDDYGEEAYDYSPDDIVWLQRPGQEREKCVVWGTQDGKYILCKYDNNDELVDNGQAFEASQLKLYDVFEDDA